MTLLCGSNNALVLQTFLQLAATGRHGAACRSNIDVDVQLRRISWASEANFVSAGVTGVRSDRARDGLQGSRLEHYL